MLLLTFKEWRGSGRDKVTRQYQFTEIKDTVFATELSLEKALVVVADYQTRYKIKYPEVGLEFTLVGVQKIDDVSFNVLMRVGVDAVESLVDAPRE